MHFYNFKILNSQLVFYLLPISHKTVTDFQTDGYGHLIYMLFIMILHNVNKLILFIINTKYEYQQDLYYFIYF